MTVPTIAEQLLLDTHPQKTDLYLSVFKPQIAMTCQVTGTYNVDDQTIDYYNPASGTYADIGDYYFQVALIGTYPGADNLGRTWVRSATATTLRFVESDHINWTYASYITVLKYTEIIPVYPRIIQDPANDENVIFYKIWDVEYTDQNKVLGSYISMGSNYAGFLENGTGTCYWSASGTSNLLGDGLTYSWIFEGAVVTGSTAHTPGYIAYNQPGHYRTIFNVTSASGRMDTSIRYISIYDRPGSGDNVPILNWEVSDWGGSRGGMGYSCRIRIRENVGKDEIIDGALVIIFGEDWYGNTKQSISNNMKGRETIKFVGYIDAGTIQYNYADGWIEFDVISPTNFMELCEGFSCSVESKTDPTTWYELINMDVRRAVYHYLTWQSTVPLCCDVEFKNFTDRNIQYFDADRTTLYDAVNTLVSGARGGKVVSDSLGKIWIEQEPDVINAVADTLPIALSLSKKDWIGEPVLDERHHQEVSFLEMGGIAYDPATNTYSPLVSNAPGFAPAYRGKVMREQGWALLDQTELNTISGNKFAYLNSRFPNAEFNLRGNYNNLDIAPQEKILVDIAYEDTPRKVVFIDKAFSVRGKDLNWNSRTKLLTNRITLAALTSGYCGITIYENVSTDDEGRVILEDGNGGEIVSLTGSIFDGGWNWTGTTFTIPFEPPDYGDFGTFDIPPFQVPSIPAPTTPTFNLGILDEHILLSGTVNYLDFIGENVNASITGTVAYINVSGTYISIYHNDVFVGVANGLNFLDDV